MKINLRKTSKILNGKFIKLKNITLFYNYVNYFKFKNKFGHRLLEPSYAYPVVHRGNVGKVVILTVVKKVN